MREKTLYWINDNIVKMMNIAKDAFPTIWGLNEEEKIRNEIIIFGDESQSNPKGKIEQLSEADIQHRITLLYRKECDRFGKDEPFFKENKWIVENSVKICQDQSFYNQIIDEWKNDEKYDKENAEEIEEIEHLVKLMGIEREQWAAIDLALIQNDIENVKQKKPVLSMALCHYLTDLYNCRCFVYSGYSLDVELVKSWKECYQQSYDGQDINVYKQKDLCKDNGKTVIDNIRKGILEK